MHTETRAQAQTRKGSTEETEDIAFDTGISVKYNWYCLASVKFKLKKKKIQNIIINYFGGSIQEHSSKMKSRENY